jgi:hypothetical protein
MDSCLVIELKITVAGIGYFVGLTPVGNSEINLDKSRDEFKSGMKQGTLRAPITVPKKTQLIHQRAAG